MSLLNMCRQDRVSFYVGYTVGAFSKSMCALLGNHAV